MKGNTFEQIAKWIGHRNVSLTANVYGQLRASEVHNSMVGMDWLGHDGLDHEKQTWRDLTDFLAEPYTLPRETPGAHPLPAPSARGVARAPALQATAVLGTPVFAVPSFFLCVCMVFPSFITGR